MKLKKCLMFFLYAGIMSIISQKSFSAIYVVPGQINGMNWPFTLTFDDYRAKDVQPCYQNIYCALGVGAHQASGPYGRGNALLWTTNGNAPKLKDLRTYGEVQDYLKTLTPSLFTPGVVLLNPTLWDGVEPICLYFMIYGGIGAIGQPFVSDVGCQQPPPPNNFCTLQPGEIILDHGTVSPDFLNGNTATATAWVQCSLDTNFSVYLRGMDSNTEIPLGSSSTVKSKVYIGGNDKVGNSKVLKAKANVPTSVEFKSVLSATQPVQPGVLSGTVVAELSFL